MKRRSVIIATMALLLAAGCRGSPSAPPRGDAGAPALDTPSPLPAIAPPPVLEAPMAAPTIPGGRPPFVDLDVEIVRYVPFAKVECGRRCNFYSATIVRIHGPRPFAERELTIYHWTHPGDDEPPSGSAWRDVGARYQLVLPEEWVILPAGMVRIELTARGLELLESRSSR